MRRWLPLAAFVAAFFTACSKPKPAIVLFGWLVEHRLCQDAMHTGKSVVSTECRAHLAGWLFGRYRLPRDDASGRCLPE